jgi:hypothetical protein
MSATPDNAIKQTPEQKLEKVLKEFQDANKTKTEDPGQNLRDLLDKSPDLKKRIMDSVDKGHLEHFTALPAGANAGGTYNSGSKTIELPMDVLKNSGKDKSSAGELIFVMGHEIQHSFNSAKSDKEVDKFVTEVNKIANGPGPHNYTSAVKNVIEAYRKDEAQAHIGGFNAISSQVMKDNPKATLKDLYNAQPGRMDDFIDRTGAAPKFTYALKPGLTIDASMKLPESADNIKAMGKHYFDQPPSATRIGAKGNQDYPNYYGEWAVNYVNDVEKSVLANAKKTNPKAVAPEVQLDLKDIGLNKSLLDTGLKYTDISPKKPIDIAPAQHGIDGHVGAVKAEPALYGQAMRALEKIDTGVGGQELRNVAATMAAQADKAGMTEITGAVKGNNGSIIAFQGDPSTDQAKRTAVDVDAAKLQPAAKALEEMGQGPKVVAMDAPQPQRSQAM